LKLIFELESDDIPSSMPFYRMLHHTFCKINLKISRKNEMKWKIYEWAGIAGTANDKT